MRRHTTRIPYFGLLALVLTIGCFLKDVHAGSAVKRSKGQTVYVPVYSHVFIGTQRLHLDLSVNASIRNTDPSNAITIVRADYYDTVSCIRYPVSGIVLAPIICLKPQVLTDLDILDVHKVL